MVTNGHRKSFQVHRNMITARVARAGPDSGRTILNSTPRREAPSILAASSSSMGSVRKNCRSRKMPNGVTRLGRISAGSVFTSPSRCTIKNVGIIVTWNGTISVASSATNSTSRPKNRIRANAYPARLQKTRLPATADSVTIMLFAKKRPNGAAFHASG